MTENIPHIIARISEDQDFFKLKEMVENHEGWNLDFSKHNIKVWTKHVDNSSFNMVKVWAELSSVDCVDLYDTIQDPEYRREWDSHMIEGIDIGQLNPNNDISYYAMSCPPPLKNRDLVLQKSWLDLGKEFFIINHSVCHKDYPPKKGFIRAISYFTGYYIKCDTPQDDKNGTVLAYVTRSDPQGVLPSWLVNKVTQIFAPKYIKQIEKAASNYRKWKQLHKPNFKPWSFPEQILAPRVSLRDCVPCQEELAQNPSLKKLDFNKFLPQISKQVTATRRQDSIDISQKLVEQSDCDTAIGGKIQHTRKSSSSSKAPKKSKSRLSSFLNFARLCRKKAK